MPSRCASKPIADCLLDKRCQWFKESATAPAHCRQVSAWARQDVAQRRSSALIAFNKAAKELALSKGITYREAQTELSRMNKMQNGGHRMYRNRW